MRSVIFSVKRLKPGILIFVYFFIFSVLYSLWSGDFSKTLQGVFFGSVALFIYIFISFCELIRDKNIHTENKSSKNNTKLSPSSSRPFSSACTSSSLCLFFRSSSCLLCPFFPISSILCPFFDNILDDHYKSKDF